jgi:acetylornithine deacetylase/succinyl-diaminopimelate desuccinylase-like protein
LPTGDQQSLKVIRDEIAAAISSSEAHLLDMSRALLAAASPNPPGNVSEAASAAERILAQIPGMTVRRVESSPGIVNLIGRLPAGRGGRRLVFNGHLDTFPIGEDLGWTCSPLAGELRDGRLYGRGISDMKGGIAASLLAASVLSRYRHYWSGEVVVTLAGDEETMGPLGTKYLLDHFPEARGDAMICGDAGSPLVIRFGEKGFLWIEIQASGSAAHGAHVHKGTNAIDRLLAALDSLKQLEKLPVSAAPEVVSAISAAKPVSEPISGAGETGVLGRLTVNIGLIEGGVSPNLVPSSASAKVDIRVPAGLSVRDVERAIGEKFAKLPGIAFHVLQRCEPNYTDPAHEIVQCVAQAARAILSREPALNMRVGASDSRLYRLAGIPAVVYGPTPYNMGAADEHVLVDDLVTVAKVHALAAFDYLSHQRQSS